MDNRRVDMVGYKIGIVEVISSAGCDRWGNAQWLCKCECGKEFVSLGCNLRKKNNTKSCGCVRARKRMKHGLTKTAEHNVWTMMIQRCTNPKYNKYKNYGGRGIGICSRWLRSFTAFYKDMGPRPPKTTLDRVDNSKGYSKSNCRWATILEQNRNRRMCDRNTCGHIGITMCKKTKKYIAQIGVDRKCINLGSFSNIEDAINARHNGELKYWR